jgi:hypothetical protein
MGARCVGGAVGGAKGAVNGGSMEQRDVGYLICGHQVPCHRCLSSLQSPCRVQKPLSNSSEGLFLIKFI